MYYTKLLVQCDSAFSEILMAELAEAGFDTFMENDSGFEAYVEEDRYDQEAVAEIKERYSQQSTLAFTFSREEKRNWNEEWEKNYEPVIVDDRCLIRAFFHQIEKKYPYEIIITPKMSFGTGHHQTTYLMIKAQMAKDHNNKRVMDAGCGTAILSIMAAKLGAREVTAFDIDEWSVINGNENVQVNDTPVVSLQQGKISEVQINGKFEIILANINKNVLLSELGTYVNYMSDDSVILLSGFYTHDIPDLLNEGALHGLREVSRDEKETWASLLLTNKN